MMLIDDFRQLLLFLGDSILLFRFKLEDEVLDMLVVDAKFSGYRAAGEFMLYEVH